MGILVEYDKADMEEIPRLDGGAGRVRCKELHLFMLWPNGRNITCSLFFLVAHREEGPGGSGWFDSAVSPKRVFSLC